MRYPIKDTIRRVYREIVKGRTNLTIVPAATTIELSDNPIFLIGIFRSGTTLMRYVIDSHSRLCCPPESNFIRAFAELLGDQDNRVGLGSMGFDESHIITKSREWVNYFFQSYASAKGKSRWADKSPGYIDFLDYIHKLFPNAQYIMIYRHGLDVAHSISQNGQRTPSYVAAINPPADDPRIKALHYWIQQTNKMLTFEKANPDKCFRTSYETLCAAPDIHFKSLFSFLGEAWESSVLEFHRFHHDRGAEDGRVIGTKGFSVRKNNYKEWPSSVIEQTPHHAMALLEELNYSI